MCVAHVCIGGVWRLERELLSNPTDQFTGHKRWACSTTGLPTMSYSRGQAVIWGVGGK